MLIKLLLVLISYISLIFIFLQDCVFVIGRQIIFFASIFIFISLFLIFIINPVKFIIKLKSFYSNTPFKYLVWFVLWLFIGAALQFDAFLNISKKVFLICCLDIIPAVLFAIYILPKYISYKKALNAFLWIYQFIMLYGVFDFVCRFAFGIKPYLYNILCSKNYFSHVFGISVNMGEVFRFRLSSIFFESSFFATFIFLFLPIVYVLLKYDIKICKNKNLNIILKFSMFFLTWFNLLFTKSPIYIIFALIYTFLFFSKDILKFIKKYTRICLIVLVLFSLLILLISSFLSLNLSQKDSVILRTAKVISAFGNMHELVSVEDSLATRILTTMNTFNAAKKVIITGCGYDNYNQLMYKEYKNSKLPMTLEIQSRWMNDGQASPNILWRMLLQAGIVGTTILYMFFLKSIYLSSKIRSFFSYNELVFLKMTNLIAINYVIISVYWLLDYYPIMWFIFGILCSYIYTYKKRLNLAKKHHMIMEK